MNRLAIARDTSPSYQYCNIQLTNLESNTVPAQTVYYNQNRSTPIINQANDYEFCITRFSLNTKNSLPVFQAAIQPGSTNPNTCIYSVTFSYGGVNYQQFLEWQPQNASIPTPAAPSSLPNGIQANSAYYYGYSYNWLPTLVQELLTSAFATFQAQCTAAGVVLPTNAQGNTPAPTIVFDSNSGISTLYLDQVCFDTYNNTTGPVIQVYFNASMASLFSFPYIVYGASSTGQNYQLICNSHGINLTEVPTTSVDQYSAVIVQEEYSSLASQNPVVSLSFVSATLPIVPTQLIPAVIFENGQQITSYSESSNAFVSEITDFEVSNGVYLPFLVYSANPYNWISLVGTCLLYTSPSPRD